MIEDDPQHGKDKEIFNEGEAIDGHGGLNLSIQIRNNPQRFTEKRGPNKRKFVNGLDHF